VLADFFEHLGLPADQCGHAGPQHRRLLQVPPGDRKHEAETRGRGDDEREELEGQAQIGRADGGGDEGADRDDAERERGCGQLGDAQYRRHDQPDDPCHDGRSASVAIRSLRIDAVSRWRGQKCSCPETQGNASNARRTPAARAAVGEIKMCRIRPIDRRPCPGAPAALHSIARRVTATSARGNELVTARGEHALGLEVAGESSGRWAWPWRAWLGRRSRLWRWLSAGRPARPHPGRGRLPGRSRLPRPHQRPAPAGRHAARPAPQPS
jgi:hypothetical protein